MDKNVIYISPDKTENLESDCFETKFDINKAILSVKKYGFYCCKNYVKGEQLKNLRLEYENSFTLKNLPFLKKNMTIE